MEALNLEIVYSIPVVNANHFIAHSKPVVNVNDIKVFNGEGEPRSLGKCQTIIYGDHSEDMGYFTVLNPYTGQEYGDFGTLEEARNFILNREKEIQ